MALGHKYSGFLRTNWENKTPKQKSKALKKQYENLGLRVPKYLENPVSNTQFARAYSRIENTYQKELNVIEKKRNEKLSLTKQVQHAILEHNKSTRATIKGLEALGLNKQEIQYLSGKEISMSVRNKSYISSEINLREINPNRVKLGTTKSKKDYIKMLKNMDNQMNVKNFEKVIQQSREKSTEWFASYLNEAYFKHLSNGQIQHMIDQFSTLSFAQQEIVIKTELNKLRERYEGMGEEDLTEVQVNNINDVINNSIYNARKFGEE